MLIREGWFKHRTPVQYEPSRTDYEKYGIQRLSYPKSTEGYGNFWQNGGKNLSKGSYADYVVIRAYGDYFQHGPWGVRSTKGTLFLLGVS